MSVSKTVIPLDDEATIRRFTEEIRRRSTPSLPSLQAQAQVERFESTTIQHNGDSHVEHRATQTDPVTIIPADGARQARNGFLAKPKSALDSVLLQSPPGNGIMAPPSTPENRPGLSNSEISQLIIDNIESLPATSTFTLGESRHAPRQTRTDQGNQPKIRGSSADDHVTSLVSKGQISQADRTIRNQSFPRLSFQAAESLTVTAPKASPAPASLAAAEASPKVLRRTSPPPVSSEAIASPTDSTASLSVLEKPASSSRWAIPVEMIASDVKEKPEEASSGSVIGPISQGTAELAVSDNEQVVSPVKEDTAKSSKPIDNWLPPHLRTPDYAFKDPRIVKPNRSYLTRMLSSGGVSKESKNPSSDGSVTKLVGEGVSAPAQGATSPNVPIPSEPILTPSSIILHAVSKPTPTVGTKENREEQLYFSAWGKPEQRQKAAAKVRKAIIRLSNPTPSLVASLVWGGIIEEIHIKTSSAEVLFANAEEFQSYCDATKNGIKYKKDGRDLVAFVEKGKDVDVVSGQLCTYLEQGFTRCVRAVDVLNKFTLGELRIKAEYKNRKVEGIAIGQTDAGLRYVVFRFCSISHAIAFKQALVRDEEWEHCNVHYLPDPCAQATGVHVEN